DRFVLDPSPAQAAGEVAGGEPLNHGHRATVRFTIRRARTLTRIATMRRTNPTTKRDSRWNGSVASVNSLAITLDIVAPWPRMLGLILRTLLPMTMVTAMVSPNARPSPSIEAPMTPDLERGRTAAWSISQRVAPSASAPSLSPIGAVLKTSRQIAVTIGRIMIARTTEAAKYDRRKNGT